MRLRQYQDNQLFYFQVQSDAGEILLTSDGYESESQRDSDAEFALANATDEDYYLVEETEGGIILKVQNASQANIATSSPYASRAALNAAFGFINEATTVAGTPYQGRDGDDDYEPLTFYQEHGSDLQSGFDSFQHEKGSFFTYKVNGIILLISEAYTSTAGRDNGIDSVTRNMSIPERYQRQVHPSGNHYFNLLAGNRQEIATSTWFRTAGEMENAIRIMLAGGQGGTMTTEIVAANRSAAISIAAAPTPVDEGAPKPKKKRKKRTSPKPKAEKVYLKDGTYLFNDLTYQIFRSGNGRHYFTFKNAEGKTLLLNADVRGYETEEEAQAVVDKIMTFGPYERNFEGKTTKNGKYYFYLKDEDGKNLGKSFFYDSTESMQSSVGLFLGSEIASATFEGGETETAAVSTANVAEEASAATGKIIDQYLDCAAYRGHARSEAYPDFGLFEHDGEYYFALLNNKDEVLLRSEAYKSEKGRENGMQSVLKNREIEERWSAREEDGQWVAILKAGNHQEIGCSCPKDSEEAARAVWLNPNPFTKVIDQYLDCASYHGHARSEAYPDFSTFEHDGQYYFAFLNKKDEVLLRSEAYKQPSGRDNGIQSIIKNKDIEERWSAREEDGKWVAILKAGNHQEIGCSCPKESEAAAIALWTTLLHAKVIDQYLSCGSYKGHERSEKYPDFSLFDYEEEYYFAMHNADGDVQLRSEGYRSPKGRENGIQSVIKNREILERWGTLEEDGLHFAILKAGNHQEIGRSCPMDTAAAALGFATWIPPVLKIPVIRDEYLSCDEYRDHGKSPIHDDFTIFQHDGMHYFAMLDNDGDVALRSQAYKSVKSRDNGIESVLKNREIEERWSTVEENGKYFGVLKAGNSQEIGRTCPKSDKAAALGWWKWSLLGLGGVIGAGTLGATTPPPPPPVTPPPPPVIPTTPPEPVIVSTTKKEEEKPVAAAAAAGGGFDWRWLLLLLLPLLLWWNGCFTNAPTEEITAVTPPPPKVETPAAVPAEPEPVAPPPAADPTPEKEVTPPPATGCTCNQDRPIFRYSGTPKSIDKLGRLPEFGDSHGLTPTQFYEKLARRHRSSAMDREYLDYIYRSMGYRGGFKDANASQFSAVELPAGTRGNLGFAEYHGYGYYELNTSQRDRQAFRLEAANGCHVHFMKTCGNYMFFCNK